jgi:hypothetical protein
MKFQKNKISKIFSQKCQKCPSDYYLNEFLIICERCPQGGQCLDGVLYATSGFYFKPIFFFILNNLGFWRSEITNKIYSCKPNPQSCL